MVVAIKGAVLAAVKWLATSAAGKALLGMIAKLAFLAFFLLALATAGYLPKSPFYLATRVIIPMMGQIPYFAYVNAFVPFYEIINIASLWLYCVITFHGIKAILRMGKIIK
jgi:hypothetical protein